MGAATDWGAVIFSYGTSREVLLGSHARVPLLAAALWYHIPSAKPPNDMSAPPITPDMPSHHLGCLTYGLRLAGACGGERAATSGQYMLSKCLVRLRPCSVHISARLANLRSAHGEDPCSACQVSATRRTQTLAQARTFKPSLRNAYFWMFTPTLLIVVAKTARITPCGGAQKARAAGIVRTCVGIFGGGCETWSHAQLQVAGSPCLCTHTAIIPAPMLYFLFVWLGKRLHAAACSTSAVGA